MNQKTKKQRSPAIRNLLINVLFVPMKHFIIDEKSQKLRLDKFLVGKTDKTRSQIQRNILDQNILVNDKPAKVHQFLNFKDKVTVLDADPNRKKAEPKEPLRPETEAGKKEIKKAARVLREQKTLTPKVVKKTKDYVIIEKPSGLLVHVTSKNEPVTLVDWLIKKYPEIKKIADPESLKKRDKIYRPGIVHRLDKDVSGLMLIALNQDAFDYYKEQFKKKLIKKEYVALVYGKLPQPHDMIEFEISRKSTGGKMASHPKGSGKGKPAQTEYKVLQEFQKFSQVKINLHTGRTNQIRVHFMALKNPVAGDELYNIKSMKAKVHIPRILLHAHTLEFTDQSGQVQKFESEPPQEFEDVIKQLK